MSARTRARGRGCGYRNTRDAFSAKSAQKWSIVINAKFLLVLLVLLNRGMATFAFFFFKNQTAAVLPRSEKRVMSARERNATRARPRKTFRFVSLVDRTFFCFCFFF